MPLNGAGTIFNAHVHLHQYVFGWKYVFKMVSSMHNEADAEDYIVWHRI